MDNKQIEMSRLLKVMAVATKIPFTAGRWSIESDNITIRVLGADLTKVEQSLENTLENDLDITKNGITDCSDHTPSPFLSHNFTVRDSGTTIYMYVYELLPIPTEELVSEPEIEF
jgi:hypothetical protein